MDNDDLGAWLVSHKLQGYQQSLRNEGYDDLRTLIALSASELEEMMQDIQMKKGHRVKLRLLIQQERDVRQQPAQADPPTQQPTSFVMPPGKDFFAFLSHKYML